MKSERRHELHHNALANWLENAGDNLRPYANHILIGLIAVVAVIIAGMWWKGQNESTAKEVATQINIGFLNQSPQALSLVAEKYPDAKCAAFSLLTAGNMYLNSGAEKLFSSKALAVQDLEKAAAAFNRVTSITTDADILAQATYGLARTAECQTNVDEAIKSYKSIQEKWPNNVLAKLAGERRADLEKKSTKEFYDKFAVYDPKPEAKGSALDGMKMPEFNKDNVPQESGAAPAGNDAAQPATK